MKNSLALAGLLAVAPTVEAHDPKTPVAYREAIVHLLEYSEVHNLKIRTSGGQKYRGATIDQIIMWDKEENVRAWKLVLTKRVVTHTHTMKKGDVNEYTVDWIEREPINLNLVPQFDFKTRMYSVFWHDDGILYVVKSKLLKESKTDYDPEVRNLKVLNREERDPVFPDRDEQ